MAWCSPSPLSDHQTFSIPVPDYALAYRIEQAVPLGGQGSYGEDPKNIPVQPGTDHSKVRGLFDDGLC